MFTIFILAIIGCLLVLSWLVDRKNKKKGRKYDGGKVEKGPTEISQEFSDIITKRGNDN
ncbi:hypothetical protein ACFYKX_03465 [Cytobacillus sp. FJAT-54145]|uniref:Uncharacterized protein n=1 Tax=Cytobacillus spartinae TaxID=3299023 RepID=A0ABW6K692_9BACI